MYYKSEQLQRLEMMMSCIGVEVGNPHSATAGEPREAGDE